ncbi:DJ-1/PfpI family protein [Marinobacter confluentis]|uniref:DJ-1/PfpI family protein n=1 Tax=Marinobacter confluentis TaxID=1697557 RepID=A0A4Z1BM72_9GAMM|nr:DJ-1/PfpI family protein [Marinobacter confluentis]TGN41167.1 DJ-1/PfpI family protein [Marinobacter confluentis]
MAFNIVIPVFPGVTQLDFTGPAQMFAYVPDAKTCVVAESSDTIQTDSGFGVVPGYDFENCPQADLICIPGGPGVFEAINNQALIAFVSHQCDSAQYLTSVCTGAFILGAAGRLKGKKATTHWGYTGALAACGATFTPGRIVTDGNLITAGGVTSGIDFSLAVIAQIWGEKLAKSIQLRMEYNPGPPFAGGHPSRSEPAVLEEVQPFYDKALARVLAALSERKEKS